MQLVHQPNHMLQEQDYLLLQCRHIRYYVAYANLYVIAWHTRTYMSLRGIRGPVRHCRAYVSIHGEPWMLESTRAENRSAELLETNEWV